MKNTPSMTVIPEHLIAFLVKNGVNPDSDVIDDIVKLKKDRPDKYGVLLSNIKAVYNGIFFYCECMEEAIFNLMFCRILHIDTYGKYRPVKEEWLDSYLKCSLSGYDESVRPLLEEFVKDLKAKIIGYKAEFVPIAMLEGGRYSTAVTKDRPYRGIVFPSSD